MGQVKTFYSFRAYFESLEDTCNEIEQIDTIISSLYQAAARAALEGDIESYTLDDGQVIVKTTRRSPEQIAKSIQQFKYLKNVLINEGVQGRDFVLRDRNSTRGFIQQYLH